MLLDQYAHKCMKVVPMTTESDEGGCRTDWTDADELSGWLELVDFTAFIALDKATDKTRGEQEGYSAVFNVLVNKSVDIHYKDYFRDDHGKVYLVASEPSIKQAPGSASFNLKNFSAKREDLP